MLNIICYLFTSPCLLNLPFHFQLFGKPIRVNKASAHQKNLDVGANIFIGNLDPEVDEKLLYDTFSAFGVILQTPKVSTVVFAGISHFLTSYAVQYFIARISCEYKIFVPSPSS